MMKGDKMLLAFLIVAVLAIVVVTLLIFGSNSSPASSPNGTSTYPQGVSEVCRSDAECSEGYYCKTGLCEPIE